MAATLRTLPNLDMDLARTFVAIAEAGNFSRAAERVHRSASAISLQVKRLEELTGRELFRRDARSVVLTRDGETFLSYARRLLKLNDEALGHFLAPEITGEVRLGVPNDSGVIAVPDILRRFAATHPLVEVSVRLDRTVALKELCEAGALDVAILSDDDRSDLPVVHEEPLVWIGARRGTAFETRPLPLAMAAMGCTWRSDALRVLEGAGLAHRVAYTSEFCQGQIAAVAADLAIAPLPASVVSPDLVRLGPETGLPALPSYRMRMQVRGGAGPATQALGEHVAESFRALAGTGARLFA